MEPFIVSVVSALAAGAIAAAKDTATQAVKDAYAGVRKYIADRYATVQLSGLEQDPQSKGQQLVVQEKLERANVEDDPTLPQLAAALVEALKSQAPDAARAVGVNLEDIRAGIDVQIRRIAQGTVVKSIEARTGSVTIEDVGNQLKNSSSAPRDSSPSGVGSVQGVSAGGNVFIAGGDIIRSASPDCRELILDILSNTFRHAFHFNFRFRFVEATEFNEVTQSIRECRIFLQSNVVRVLATCSKELAAVVQTMLQQVQLMEAIFRKMQPFVNTYARIDNGDPPEMMDVFTHMETLRVEFLISIKSLYEKANVPLPFIPSEWGVISEWGISSERGVIFGFDGFLEFRKGTSLREMSVKDLADALKEWRQECGRI
jgi:hypothetical protein